MVAQLTHWMDCYPQPSHRVSKTAEHVAPLSSVISALQEPEDMKSQNLSKERPHSRTYNAAAPVSPHPTLTIDMIDLPSIQRGVVEHIVKT